MLGTAAGIFFACTNGDIIVNGDVLLWLVKRDFRCRACGILFEIGKNGRVNRDHQVEDKDEEACYPVSDLCPSCNSGSGRYGDQESIDLSLVDFVDLSRTSLTQKNRDDFKNHYDAAKQKENEQKAFKALLQKRQVLEKI